jgi:hypothetical protein
MTKKAGSGSASGSASISKRHGSEDPNPDADPHQNVMDPHHWSHSPEVVGRAKVQLSALIVGDDPGEHGVLIEVVVGPARDRVQEHEVFEVRDLASLPFGRHVRGSGVSKNSPIIQQSKRAKKTNYKNVGLEPREFFSKGEFDLEVRVRFGPDSTFLKKDQRNVGQICT